MTLTVQEDMSEDYAALESQGGDGAAALSAASGAVRKVRRDRYKDTGVKRVFVIGLIPNAPENYTNMKIILSQLQLSNYNIASDFKVVLVIMIML